MYKINYNEKINMLKKYFGISEECAKYMFHRRRRGFPFKKDGDVSYLEWSILLQNIIVLADLHYDDFNSLEFSNDISELLNYIDISTVSKTHTVCNKISNSDLNQKKDDVNEWCLVSKKTSRSVIKNHVKKMGFIISTKHNKIS